MEPQVINYNALEDKRIFNDKKPPLDRWTNWLPRPWRSPVKIILLLILVVLFFTVALLLALIIGIFLELMPSVAWLIIISLTGVLFWLRKRQKRKDTNLRTGMSNFARQNNWHYGLAGKLVTTFNNGKEVRTTDLDVAKLYSVKGKLQAHDFELLIGWKEDNGGPVQFLTPQLFVASKKILPEAVLVSRDITDGTKIADRLFVKYDDPSRVSLEGDFDTWFQLYVPHGTHIDAMSLIAPDFMQTAKDFISRFTIQMSKNTFVLTPAATDKPSKELLIDIFSAAQKLLHETDY